jgi:WD40 repeat protein
MTCFNQFKRKLSILGISLLFSAGLCLSAIANPYKEWPGLTGFVRFSPTGNQLIRQADRTLEIWSVNNKKLLRKMGVSEPLVDAQFSANGKFIVAGSEDGVYTVWRTSDYKRIHELKDPPLDNGHQPFALSPDGKYLTVCKLNEVTLNQKNYLDFYLHIWDLESGKKIDKIFVSHSPNRLPGHLPVVYVAWHPLGRYLTTAMESDQGGPKITPTYLQVLDLWEGRWLYWIPGSAPAEYSQNGRYFAFLSPMTPEKNVNQSNKWQIKLWNTRVNLFKTFPSQHSLAEFSGLTLSSKGRLLAYLGSVSANQKEVVIYATEDLKILTRFRIPEEADSLSISPDEKNLLVSSFSDPTFAVRVYRLDFD